MSRCLYVVDPVSNLYTLDAATGSSRTIGSVGIANVTDIAFHGPTLYGVSFAQLLRLDPDRATGTTIGSIGFTTNGLAVAADGTIYAGTTTGELITINPVTGAGTLVGSFGGGLTSSGDLAFDSNHRSRSCRNLLYPGSCGGHHRREGPGSGESVNEGVRRGNAVLRVVHARQS